MYYKSRVGGTWSSRLAVEQGTSDNPTLMVRAPNEVAYGTGTGGVYWKGSSSETYFFQIPEFEAFVVPALLAAILFSGLRRARIRTRLQRDSRVTGGPQGSAVGAHEQETPSAGP